MKLSNVLSSQNIILYNDILRDLGLPKFIAKYNDYKGTMYRLVSAILQNNEILTDYDAWDYTDEETEMLINFINTKVTTNKSESTRFINLLAKENRTAVKGEMDRMKYPQRYQQQQVRQQQQFGGQQVDVAATLSKHVKLATQEFLDSQDGAFPGGDAYDVDLIIDHFDDNNKLHQSLVPTKKSYFTGIADKNKLEISVDEMMLWDFCIVNLKHKTLLYVEVTIANWNNEINSYWSGIMYDFDDTSNSWVYNPAGSLGNDAQGLSERLELGDDTDTSFNQAFLDKVTELHVNELGYEDAVSESLIVSLLNQVNIDSYFDVDSDDVEDSDDEFVNFSVSVDLIHNGETYVLQQNGSYDTGNNSIMYDSAEAWKESNVSDTIEIKLTSIPEAVSDLMSAEVDKFFLDTVGMSGGRSHGYDYDFVDDNIITVSDANTGNVIGNGYAKPDEDDDDFDAFQVHTDDALDALPDFDAVLDKLYSLFATSYDGTIDVDNPGVRRQRPNQKLSHGYDYDFVDDNIITVSDANTGNVIGNGYAKPDEDDDDFDAFQVHTDDALDALPDFNDVLDKLYSLFATSYDGTIDVDNPGVRRQRPNQNPSESLIYWFTTENGDGEEEAYFAIDEIPSFKDLMQVSGYNIGTKKGTAELVDAIVMFTEDGDADGDPLENYVGYMIADFIKTIDFSPVDGVEGVYHEDQNEWCERVYGEGDAKMKAITALVDDQLGG